MPLLLTLNIFHNLPCSSVSIVNFEQVNAGWDITCAFKVSFEVEVIFVHFCLNKSVTSFSHWPKRKKEILIFVKFDGVPQKASNELSWRAKILFYGWSRGNFLTWELLLIRRACFLSAQKVRKWKIKNTLKNVHNWRKNYTTSLQISEGPLMSNIVMLQKVGTYSEQIYSL